MNKISTINTFQISTDQVPTSHQISTEIESFQIADEQVRIDNVTGRSNSPHFRAAQLKEFTSWLAVQNKQQSVQQKPHIDMRRSKTPAAIISPPAKKSKPILRVDDPATQPLSKNKHPHFDTSNYVANPADIQKVIAELKADGRVIGDAKQLDDSEPTTNAKIQNFTWPDVTELLLDNAGLVNLQMNIQNAMARNCKQFVVCSAESGAGATTIVMALARQMAARNQRVLLVDADISNAVLANRLGVRFQSSWLQAVSQPSELPEIYVSDQDLKVSLLPLQRLSQVSWPRTILDQLGMIISTIAYQFDAVLIDAGTAAQFLNETSSPKSLGEIILYVENQDSLSNPEARQQKTKLISANKNGVIVVENFSDTANSLQAKVG